MGRSLSAAAFIVGPRHGRFAPTPDQGLVDLSPHSTSHIAQGFFILVFGFLAFNGGSQASINADGDGIVVAKIFVTTVISCATGGLVVLFANRFLTGFVKVS